MNEQTPSGARVLVIDDDLDLLANVRHSLQAAGYRVTTADTLADGLAKAASLPFHVCRACASWHRGCASRC